MITCLHERGNPQASLIFFRRLPSVWLVQTLQILRCLCSVSKLAGQGVSVVEHLLQFFFKRLEAQGSDNNQVGISLKRSRITVFSLLNTIKGLLCLVSCTWFYKWIFCGSVYCTVVACICGVNLVASLPKLVFFFYSRWTGIFSNVK